MFTVDQLKLFVRVAEARSFSKAASAEYISSNAVIKQMNNLENSLRVVLFNRTNKGVELTACGTFFYEKAKYIIGEIENAVYDVRNMENNETLPVRIAVFSKESVGSVAVFLTRLLQKNPDIRVTMIPYPNNPEIFNDIYSEMGKDIDVICSTYDKYALERWSLNAIETHKESLYVVMSSMHPLGDRKSVYLDDLRGFEIMLTQEGVSYYVDNLRKYIKESYSDIKVTDMFGFSIDMYNEISQSQKMFIGIGARDDIHPLVKRVPLAGWDEKVSAGIIYSKISSQHVSRFIELAMREIRC